MMRKLCNVGYSRTEHGYVSERVDGSAFARVGTVWEKSDGIYLQLRAVRFGILCGIPDMVFNPPFIEGDLVFTDNDGDGGVVETWMGWATTSGGSDGQRVVYSFHIESFPICQLTRAGIYCRVWANAGS